MPHLDFRFDARPALTPLEGQETVITEDEVESQLVRSGYLNLERPGGGVGNIGNELSKIQDAPSTVNLNVKASDEEVALVAARLRLSVKEARLVERVFRMLFSTVSVKS